MTHKVKGALVEEYAYCANKLRQNVGLEIWIWGQIVTSQTVHTKYIWPPYATEWKPPHENYLRTPLHVQVIYEKIEVLHCLNLLQKG